MLRSGVAGGINAESILKTLKVKKLYLIDPYVPYLTRGKLLDCTETFVEARERLGRFSQARLIRKPSSQGIRELPDSLDFVYIDGNHAYESVKEDITLCYPKIKLGGVLGGHDFFGDCQGVCRAAIEFADKHGKELFTEKGDWWIIK